MKKTDLKTKIMNPLTNFVKHSWKRPLNGHTSIPQVDGGDGEQLKEEDHFSFLSEYWKKSFHQKNSNNVVKS